MSPCSGVGLRFTSLLHHLRTGELTILTFQFVSSMESQDVSNTHLTEYEEEKISIRLVSVKKPLYVGTQEL